MHANSLWWIGNGSLTHVRCEATTFKEGCQMLIICRKKESFMEVDDCLLTPKLGITLVHLEGFSELLT